MRSAKEEIQVESVSVNEGGEWRNGSGKAGKERTTDFLSWIIAKATLGAGRLLLEPVGALTHILDDCSHSSVRVGGGYYF